MTDTQKIVERLRKGSVGTWDGEKLVDLRPTSEEIREAADTIERLTAQLNEARAEDSIHSNTERSASSERSTEQAKIEKLLSAFANALINKQGAMNHNGAPYEIEFYDKKLRENIQALAAILTHRTNDDRDVDTERAGVSVNQLTEETE